MKLTQEQVADYCAKLTSRDIAVLNAIKEYRYLNREQLSCIVNNFPSVGVLNRRLRVLYERDFIDRYFPQVGVNQGSSQQYVSLSRTALLFFGVTNYNRPIKYVDGERYLPSNWRHHSAIIDVHCWLLSYAPILNYSVSFSYKEKSHLYKNTKIIPDLFTLIKREQVGHMFFFEVDNGTETLERVHRKLKNYANYRMSDDWRKTPWARMFTNFVFPKVILIVRNESSRANRFREFLAVEKVPGFVITPDTFYTFLEKTIKGG